MRVEPVYLLQGREVPAHPFSKQLEEEVIEVIATGVQGNYQLLAQQKVADLECPEHHQKVVVQIVAVTYAEAAQAFDGDYQINACCPEFQTAVLASLQLH